MNKTLWNKLTKQVEAMAANVEAISADMDDAVIVDLDDDGTDIPLVFDKLLDAAGTLFLLALRVSEDKGFAVSWRESNLSYFAEVAERYFRETPEEREEAN